MNYSFPNNEISFEYPPIVEKNEKIFYWNKKKTHLFPISRAVLMISFVRSTYPVEEKEIGYKNMKNRNDFFLKAKIALTNKIL